MGIAEWLKAACAVVCTLAAGQAAADEWRSLETPHYSVLSQLSERDTRAWAAEFDVFIDSFSGLLGARSSSLPPLTVVLFSPEARASGCSVRHGTWGLSDLRRTGGDGTTRQTALREGVRWLTRPTAGTHPQWLETGLAEVFSTFDVRGGHVRWGTAMPDHMAVLRERGLVPLREFLDHPDAVVTRDGDARRYTAQAWALTHLLLLGGDPARRERFSTWLRHRGLQGGDASFRAAFSDDLELVQQDLGAYVERPYLEPGITPRGMVERRYVMTAASRFDVEAALGRLEVAR